MCCWCVLATTKGANMSVKACINQQAEQPSIPGGRPRSTGNRAWWPRPVRSWPTQYEYQIFGHNCNCNFLLAVYLAALIDCAAAAVLNPPDKSTLPALDFITVGENEKFMPIFRTLRGAGRRVAQPGRLSRSGDNTLQPAAWVLQARRACNKV